jgi:hypothetical protein
MILNFICGESLIAIDNGCSDSSAEQVFTLIETVLPQVKETIAKENYKPWTIYLERGEDRFKSQMVEMEFDKGVYHAMLGDSFHALAERVFDADGKLEFHYADMMPDSFNDALHSFMFKEVA